MRLSLIMKERVKLWPLLLPLFILAPGLLGFPYPSSQTLYSDLTITHYPYAVFLKRAIYTHGAIPLWSPLFLSGHPFIANPLSGIWYPPGWLATLLPLPLGFNIMIALHLFWGGLGMYYLLRSEGVNYESGILGALAFGLLPKIFAHYGAGHLTFLYAIPWTPWLLLTSKQRRGGWVWPVNVLTMIILADVRWAAYSIPLWWLYRLFSGIWHSKEGKGSSRYQFSSKRIMGFGDNLRRGIYKFDVSNFQFIPQTILAVCIAAPLILPLYEFTTLSSRAHLSPQEILNQSLPPPRLIGLFFPDIGGYHEWILYPGAVVLILSVLSVFQVGKRSKKYFWFGISAITLIFSLGSNVPIVSVFARMPGFNLLRVPSRTLFLFGMAICMLAAHSVNELLVKNINSKTIRRMNLILVSSVTFAFAISFGIWFITGTLDLNYIYGTLFLLAVSIWMGFFFRDRITQRAWIIGILILGILDWVFVDISSFSSRSRKQVLSEQISVVQYLGQQEGYFRVYSPSYSIPQQMSALYGLELADGVDPLQLMNYMEFMDVATGVPRLGYSVTLPSFEDGDPTKDNKGYKPDPTKLGLLNVKYLASEFDLSAEGLVLLEQFGETRIYENLEALPRSWVQPQDVEIGEEAVLANIVEWKPNMIRIRARGPGLLVLSELAYPGWQVFVDGKKSDLIKVEDLLRGVILPSGEHEVTFSFYPKSVYIGLAISAGVILFMILFLSWKYLGAERQIILR